MQRIMKINNDSLLIKDNQKKCIYVLALGGTIASIAQHPSEEFYSRPSADIDTLISKINLKTKDIRIVSEQLFQKISHELTHEDLFLVARKINDLANNANISGIVVTHGTNCIEETAYFISLVINTQKPIVFTGSFRPYNALGYDGDRNLNNAILIANSHKSLGIGVVLTFNDSIVNARDACPYGKLV